MNASNFGVDAPGRPVVLDFSEIGWLPESLDLYTLFRTTGFARKVVAHLFSPEEATRLCTLPNLASMSELRMFLGMAAVPNLITSVYSHCLESCDGCFLKSGQQWLRED